MATDKNKKILNAPALRFPEFSGEWASANLSSFAQKITKKNKGNIISNVLCNSANLGIIPQSEYFDRDIANSDNTDTYYVIKNGDFVYNPRKSVTAPYGPVNMYKGEDVGIISPLYLCFTVNGISKDFLLNWFKGITWYKYVYSHGDTGARFDRVSIKDDIFLNMPINVPPCITEQEKISEILGLLDERIATQKKIIDNLKSLIKGLAQQLQSSGVANKTWSKVLLSDILTERTELNEALYPVHSVSVIQGVVNQIEYLGRSFAAKDTSNYHVARFGNIIYTKSPTGEFPYGIIKRSNVVQPAAISPLYGVYECVSDDIAVILHYYFASPINTSNYLHPLIQKGAKNTINITNSRFLENEVILPKSKDEAAKVASLLCFIQHKIDMEMKQHNQYILQKQYLLRTMFI